MEQNISGQADDILIMFRDIQKKLIRDANRMLKKENITYAQARVVMLLSEAEEKELTNKELESIMGVSQQTMADTVCRMEQKGLVESYHNDRDRRIKCVRITEEGEHLAEIVSVRRSFIEETIREVFTEEEFRSLTYLLTKLDTELD